MKIVCDTNFKHGRDAFAAGDQRTVEDDVGAYLVKCGWAHVLGDPGPGAADSDPVETTLDIQSVIHKTEAKNG